MSICSAKPYVRMTRVMVTADSTRHDNVGADLLTPWPSRGSLWAFWSSRSRHCGRRRSPRSTSLLECVRTRGRGVTRCPMLGINRCHAHSSSPFGGRCWRGWRRRWRAGNVARASTKPGAPCTVGLSTKITRYRNIIDSYEIPHRSSSHRIISTTVKRGRHSRSTQGRPSVHSLRLMSRARGH